MFSANICQALSWLTIVARRAQTHPYLPLVSILTPILQTANLFLNELKKRCFSVPLPWNGSMRVKKCLNFPVKENFNFCQFVQYET